MTQIATIIQSLNEIATEEAHGGKMPEALATAGFVGGLHHGTDASRDEPKPFGLLNATQIDSDGNSSGVRLVEYRVDLTVVVEADNNVLGKILATFHRYWDRLIGLNCLPSLDPDYAKFVWIFPEAAESGEAAEQTTEGKDILLGVTSWTLALSEHQPALEE